MRMRVLFLDKVHPILKKGLKSLSFICHEDYESEKNDICNKIDNYHGIIIRSRFKLDKGFLKSASNLKFIARAGSGLENIDLDFVKIKELNAYMLQREMRKLFQSMRLECFYLYSTI